MKKNCMKVEEMALLKIVKYGDPVLETPGDFVTEFDDDLKKLVADMFETMYNAPGVGLAAPQVGVSQRIFVMDCSGGSDPAQRVAMINPSIINVEGEQVGEKAVSRFLIFSFPSSAACVRLCARKTRKEMSLSWTAWT
ncbi:MAG: peptide deformylase [Pyrinomonadaceae bacterium]